MDKKELESKIEEEMLEQMDRIARGALLEFGDFDENQVNKWCNLRNVNYAEPSQLTGDKE